MNNLKIIFIATGLILLATVSVLYYNQLNPRMSADTLDQTIASGNIPSKQLSDISVLETLDMNKPVPQYKLNVQAHGNFSSTPAKLILVDKTTNKGVKQLNLIKSQYSTECMLHNEMASGEMSKWESEWFAMPEIGEITNTYTSKLTDKYSVQVLYSDASLSKFMSTNSISGVCYQISKAVPSTPNPQEQLSEE